jgi:hypothetical protein
MIVNGLNIDMGWIVIATPDLIRGKQSHEIALRQAQGNPIMVSLSNHSLLAMTAFLSRPEDRKGDGVGRIPHHDR